MARWLDFSVARLAKRGKSLGEQLKTISNQVGSFFSQRDNFRLTPVAKGKFTEKLRQYPRESSITAAKHWIFE